MRECAATRLSALIVFLLGVIWCGVVVAQVEGGELEGLAEERRGPVTISGALAFGGVMPRSGGVTALVEVVNKGPEVSVELRLTANDVTRRVDVDLGANSRRRLQIRAPVPRFGSLVLTAHEPGEGATLDRVSLKSRRVGYGGRVVAFIGARPPGLARDLFESDEALEGDGFAAKDDNPLVIVPATAAELPESVDGYDVLSVLFWTRPRSDELTPAQAAALLRWVRDGGHLVVAVDEGAEALEGGALWPLLPALPGGVEVVEDPTRLRRLLDVALQGADGDADVDLPERLPLLKCEALPGAAPGPESRGDDDPLTWTWMVGDGRVTLWRTLPGRMSLKPALDSWHKWLIVAERSTRDEVVWSTTHHDEPKLDINIIGLLMVLLTYLAIIGPIDYLVLRKLRRLDWTLVTYPAAIMVFSLLAWLAMVTSVSSQSVAVQYTLVNWPLAADAVQGAHCSSRGAQREQPIDVRVYHGYFPTSRQRVTAAPERPGDLLMPGEELQSFGTKVASTKIALVGTPARFEIVAAAYAMTPILGIMERRSERAPVTVKVEEASDGAQTLVVENHLSLELKRCWAHVAGMKAPSLFDIPAMGRSEVFNLEDDPSPSLNRFIDSHGRFDGVHFGMASSLMDTRLDPETRGGGSGEVVCMTDVGGLLDAGFEVPAAEEETKRGLVRFMF